MRDGGVNPTAVLAEDEPLLADELEDMLLALWPELRIVGRASDGAAALSAIEGRAPDLAFLDIHMPLIDGIHVARRVAGRCHVVFLTSFDQHAIDAFEAGALDYVLKPPTHARLAATVQRLKARLRSPPTESRDVLERLANSASLPTRYLQWINASRGATVRLITVDEVLFFKSDLKYTQVATADSDALIRKSIRELVDELDPTMFWQVHRSTLVNVHAIDSVVRDDRGNLRLRLKQRPEVLPVSEAYVHLFRQM